jgi:hypothetical protein
VITNRAPTLRARETKMTKKKAKPLQEDFPLTISFDSAEVRQAFIGWLSDGGGESDFAGSLRDDAGLTLDVDYDSDELIVVNAHGRV